jgi:hypothetical protein
MTYEEFSKEYVNMLEQPKYCVPVWRYRNNDEHTFLRIYNPRTNQPEIIVILEDCLDKFSCIEITEKDMEYMN